MHGHWACCRDYRKRLIRLGVPKGAALKIERVVTEILKGEQAHSISNDSMAEFLLSRNESLFWKRKNFGPESLKHLRKLLDDHELPALDTQWP